MSNIVRRSVTQDMPSGEPALSAPKTPSQWSVDELIPFGKYILLNKISAGATAAVYRAKIRGEAGFERLVTIKRILPQMAGDPDFVETFVHEAKVCARLTHANICPIYELGKVGESLYMASEWVAGKDLRAILFRLQQTGRVMPPLAAAFIASRLCDALDYAHGLKDAKGERLNLLHMDLSPANILLSYEGAVKLLDFGLARASGRAQQTNVDALKQKLGYMSPELVLGTPVDRRSDLFGVGVCLYEMVTGKRLFAGADDIATLKLLRNATVPPPSALQSDTPDELETIIMRSLARDPEQRWPSAGEMAHALTAFVVAGDPGFGTRNLAEMMQSLFDIDRVTEQNKLNTLLTASQDANLIEQRRRFFSSPLGAAAIAKAEATRKHQSTRPPPPNAFAAANSRKDASTSNESLTGSHISERKARPLPPAPAGAPAPAPAPANTTTQSPEDDALTTYRPPDQPTAAPTAPIPAITQAPAPAIETPRPGAYPRGGLTTAENYNELIRRSAGDKDDSTDDAVDEPTMYRPEASTAANKADTGRITQPSPAGKPDPNSLLELQNEVTVFELNPDEFLEADKPDKPAAAADFESEATHYIAGGGQPSAALALFDGKAPLTYDEEATHIFFSSDGKLPDVPDEDLTTASPPKPLRVPMPLGAPAANRGGVRAPLPPPAAGRQPTGGHAAVPAAVAKTVTASRPSDPRIGMGTLGTSLASANRAPLYWVLGVALVVLLTGLIVKTPLGISLGVRKPPTASVEIRTTPDVSASIRLDGIYRGHAPLRLEGVPAGARTITVTADNYEPQTVGLLLEGGSSTTETITLTPSTPTPIASP
ncbi:MAG TPA: protein kinase [Polyangiales bacterium]|nr:protein kinase [Polyangiales bacterium]